MKYLLAILFLIILSGFGYGYYIKPIDPKTGNLFIGLSVCGLFFVLMPLFSYYRWKDKDIKDYMLTKENLDKMKEKNNRKKL
jgi:hypothetical protein